MPVADHDLPEGLEPALREQLAGIDRPTASPHPDDATWERYAEGALTDAQRESVVDHALACPECRALLRALGELRRGASAAEPRAAKLRGAWGASRLPLWIGLAAAVIVLVALPARWPLRRGAPPPGGETALRSGNAAVAVQTLGPRGRARRPLEPFAWETVPGADAYCVRLFSADGRLVWKSPRVAAPATAVQLGPEVGLPAGTYVWSVEAEHDGETLAVSQLVTFELSP